MVGVFSGVFLHMQRYFSYNVYIRRHRCAGGPKKKLYQRLGSRFGVLSLTVWLTSHATAMSEVMEMPLMFARVRLGCCLTPYQRPTLHNGAPFSRLLRHAGDTEDVFLT